MLDLGLHRDTQENVTLNPNDLNRHMAVFGTTGSGKSGFLIGLAEELIKNKTPLILVDIKGDLINLVIQQGSLRDKIFPRLLTPGATHGDPVNAFSNINKKEHISITIRSLLEMLGIESDPLKSAEHVLLSSLLHYYHHYGEEISLPKIISGTMNPPMKHLGALPLDKAISKSKRGKLASQLNNILASPFYNVWRNGISLDFDTLFSSTYDKRVPVIIYSVSHLPSQEEKQFALTYFLSEYRSWLFSKSGSRSLRASLFIDECVGLLPPHPYSPATKRDIMLLLKQGRAFGGGVILSTQNPKDIDYKGLSNCGTWVLGRLQTVNDRERVIEGLLSTGNYNKKQLHTLITALKPRQFVLAQDSKWKVFRTKDTEAVLKGPMTIPEIEDLKKQGLLCTIYNLSLLCNEVIKAKTEYHKHGTFQKMRQLLSSVSALNNYQNSK